MQLRVLTWNLMHGRSVPPSGRDLLAEFSRALQGWVWDVALLQEVPPWWSPALARAVGGEYRQVLTSRNALPGLRRAIARRRPDLIKSNGGSANTIIARYDRVGAERAQRLCRTPERRWAHGVQLGSGIWVVNMHATAHDTAAAWRDLRTAAGAATEWAAGAPLVFGGDLNLREPTIDGFVHIAGHDVDHVFTAGPVAAGNPQVLDRSTLSDHAPVAATVRLP